jgi:hypothetical protein
MGFAEIDSPLLAIHLRGAQHNEERLAVPLDLWPLVGAMSVLDRKIVQAKLLLDLSQQVLLRLV